MTEPRTSEDSQDWRVEHLATGPVVFAHDGQGGWLRLHSGRDPLGEAGRLVDAAFPDGTIPPVVTVLGCGMGYVVDILEQRAPDTTVLVIEPAPLLARLFLSRRDWSARVRSRRLFLFVGPEYEASPEAAAQLEACPAAPPVMVHPVLARLWPQRLATGQQKVERIRFARAANAEARRRFATPYLLNTLGNLRSLVEEADVTALDGAFAGRPAFVVGAGPSLDNNMAALARVRETGVLICVDTALRPLMRHGIVPDIVVAIDPSELNARHLSSAPVDARMFLVTEASVDPRALRAFRGRTFFYRVARHHPWPWLAEHGIERGLLRAWGSVLVSAMDLACRMGADPVTFFGADLAYTGNRSHCSGVAHEEIWALRGLDAHMAARERLDSPDTRTCESIDGTRVPTLPHLLEFRDWIVEHLPRDREILNATQAGLLHGEGIRQVEPVSTLTGTALMNREGMLSGCHEKGRTSTRALPKPDDETRRTWLRDVPGLSNDRLAAAVASCVSHVVDAETRRAALVAPAVTAVMMAVGRRRGLPEWARDALLDASIPGGTLEACLHRASIALDTLVTSGVMTSVCRPAAGELLELVGAPVPASVLVELPAPMAEALAEFEQCIAHLAARTGTIVDSLTAPVWSTAPILGPNAETRARSLSSAHAFAEGWIRWFLVSTYLEAHANVERALSAEEPASRDVPPRRVSPERTFEVPVDVEPWMLGRAIQGTLVLPNHDGRRLPGGRQLPPRPSLVFAAAQAALDPRVMFLQEYGRRTPFIDLVGQGLPLCGHVVTLDSRTALATPFGSTRGIRITEDGAFGPDDVEWTLPVSGIAIGPRDRIAWTYDNGGVVAAWRDGACRRLLHVDTRLSRVVSDGADGVICSSYEGPVWRLAGLGEAERIGSRMPGIAVTRGTDVFIAETRRGTDGVLDRELTGVAWHWRDGRWDAIPSGPVNAPWSVACQGGWTAAAHPHADTVTLELREEPVARLAVYYPTCVAWAGRSLVVINADGAVLLFRGLAGILEGLVWRSSISIDDESSRGCVHVS